MLRRTLTARATLNKGVQQPGPTLHGWGRTMQKRRLEYETVESKYHKREFNKNWDLCGYTSRSTDHLEIRTYFRYPQHMFMWAFNQIQVAYTWIPGAGFFIMLHFMVAEYDRSIIRASWW